MEKIKLVYKVLNGEANESERRELESLINSDPVLKEDYSDIKFIIERARTFDESEPRSKSFYDGLKKIQSRIEFKKTRRLRFQLYKTALLIMLIAAIFFLILF